MRMNLFPWNVEWTLVPSDPQFDERWPEEEAQKIVNDEEVTRYSTLILGHWRYEMTKQTIFFSSTTRTQTVHRHEATKMAVAFFATPEHRPDMGMYETTKL